ncbi:WAT1-related protein isoform X1 [Gossypium australe]|uniref:WAT1-related protein n=1 Tax=Gossypium australe TaxID=47621 RepID=A0A5B6V4Z2_9ROSI|nr:WAT1-related protein isoform X1 [Gossypium australe]
MDYLAKIFGQTKPFVAVILLQFGFAGMSLISKYALNEGMSQHVLVVYRHAVATLVIAPFALVYDRFHIFRRILLIMKIRPKMTLSIFVKILLLGLLEPTIDQNLFYSGMKYTSATFTSAMCNVLPAFAFIFAWIFNQAKIIGTIVSVGGAMLMTLIKGPMLQLPWVKSDDDHAFSSAATHQYPIKGAIMITIGCFSWAAFIILQAITLKSYPAELSLTALICLVGTIEGCIVALAMEAGNAAVWSIHLDAKLLAAVYSVRTSSTIAPVRSYYMGVICSGIAYYVQGMVMKTRGPVFVTAFSPLSMVVIAIFSSFILSEILYLGRVIGAIVIVVGLYLVLWGKSKDQTSSNQDIQMEGSNDLKMIPTIDETTKVSNQELVVLDLTSNKVTPTDEYV